MSAKCDKCGKIVSNLRTHKARGRCFKVTPAEKKHSLKKW